MSSIDSNESMPPRRRLLGAMASVAGVSAAGLLGLNAPGASAEEARPLIEQPAPEELFALARLRNYKARRSSSWDRTGGNGDAVPVGPGQAATLLEVTGAGVVTHLWFTINSRGPHALEESGAARLVGRRDRRPRSRFPSATSSAWGWASTSSTNRR